MQTEPARLGTPRRALPTALFRRCRRFLCFLGLLLFRDRLWPGDDGRAAAGFLDLFLRAGAKAVSRHSQLFGQLAIAEDFEDIEPLFDDTGFDERVGCDGSAGVKELLEI